MRALLILAAIAVIGLALGIIHIQRDNGSIEISIDKTRLKDATSKAFHKGEEVLENIEKGSDGDGSTAKRFQPSSSR